VRKYLILILAIIFCDNIVFADSLMALWYERAGNINGIWNVNSGGDWSIASNWTNNIIARGTGSTAVFPNIITANATITNSSPWTVGNITAIDTTHNYTIGGSSSMTLDVSSGVSTISNTSGRITTISAPTTINDGLEKTGSGTLSITGLVILGASQTWLNNSGGALNAKGGIDTDGYTLTFNGSAAIDVSSTTNIITGTGGLIKSGTHLLTLGAGANATHNYSGQTTINGGRILFSSNLSTNSNIEMTGGILESYWTSPFTRSLGTGANQIRFTSGECGISMNGANAVNYNLGAITWGTPNFNPSKFLLNSAASQNNASVTLTSSINLNGTNRIISAHSGLSGIASATLSGVISGAGGLTKEGNGKLILSGNNTYTGDLSISSGTLELNTTTNAWGSPFKSVTFTGTSTLFVQNAASAYTIGNMTVDPGVTATMTPSTSNSQTITNLTGSGTLSWGFGNGGATLTLSNASTFTGILKVTPGSSSSPIVQFSNIADTNYLSFGGNGSFSGSTFRYVGSTPTVFTNRQFRFESGASTLTSHTIENNASTANTWTILPDVLNSATTAKTLILGGSNSGINVFAGAITNGVGSVVSLTKSGLGTWAISGTNTFTGGLTIPSAGGLVIVRGAESVAGCLSISISSAGGGASALRILASGSGAINITPFLKTVNQNSSVDISVLIGNNSVANGGGGGAATTGAVITSPRMFFDGGSTAVNAGFGSITANNGYSLQFNQVDFKSTPQTANWAPTFGSGNCPIIIDGTVRQLAGCTTQNRNIIFQLSGTSNSNVINGNIMNPVDYPANTNTFPLAIRKSGTGTWTLSGTNTFSGTNTISAGKLIMQGTSSVSTSSVISITNTATIELNYDGGVTIPALISNNVVMASGAYSITNMSQILGTGYLIVP